MLALFASGEWPVASARHHWPSLRSAHVLVYQPFHKVARSDGLAHFSDVVTHQRNGVGHGELAAKELALKRALEHAMPRHRNIRGEGSCVRIGQQHVCGWCILPPLSPL